MNIFSMVFGPEKGAAFDNLKNFESRPQQSVMANRIMRAFHDKHPAVIEAPTGVGKSLAYLLPAIQWTQKTGQKVVISTFTKTLQEQLVHKELPRLKKLLGIDFHYALCLGSNNFLCKRRFARNGLPELFTQSRNKEELEKITQWMKATETGLLSDLPFEPNNALWNQINRDSELCMRRKSPYFEECFYYKQKKEIERASILITNHHLFFTHIASGGKLLPAFNAVIFDEAHTLENVATEHLGYSISNDQLKFHLDSFYNPITEHGLLTRVKLAKHNIKIGAKLVDDIRKGAQFFFSELVHQLGAESRKARIRKKELVNNTLEGPLLGLISFLEETLITIQSKEDEKEWLALIKKFKEISLQIDVILNMREPDHVYWVEIAQRSRGPRLSLHKAPLDISRVFRKEVLQRIQPAIFVSATLAANGRLDFFKDCFGLDRQASELLLDSPFDYAKNVLLYLPESMPDPGGEKPDEFYEKALGEVKRLISLMQGRIFILMTSFELVGRAGKTLAQEFPHLSILKQGDRPNHRLIKQFKENERSVLLGTNTFWQGVDIPGRALEGVVLWKLPFAVPDEPIAEAKMERLEAQGKNAFVHYQLPRAIIMTRQGFGRLVRRQTDQGIVAILDSRIKGKAYGQDFLNSLPPCARTSKFNDVENFFAHQLCTPKS